MDESALLEELKRLRKGRGLSPARVAGCEAVRTVLGDPPKPAEVLASRIEALGDSIQARALRNAFGLDMADPLNLTRRRNDFAVRNDKHTDTVEAWENEMLGELVHQLLEDSPDTELVKPTPEEALLAKVADWLSEEFDVIDLRLDIIRYEDARPVDNSDIQLLLDTYGMDALRLTDPQRQLFDIIMATKDHQAQRQLRIAKQAGKMQLMKSLGVLLGLMTDRVLKKELPEGWTALDDMGE